MKPSNNNNTTKLTINIQESLARRLTYTTTKNQHLSKLTCSPNLKPKLAGRGKVCARLCSIHGSKEGIRWSWPMLLEADSSKVSTRRTVAATIIARVATLAPWQQQGKEKS